MEFPTGMTPETWPLFTSTRHGYSIRYSPDWHATQSSEDRLPDVLDDSVRLDAFGSRLSIRRRPLPPGKTIWEVAQAWLPQAPLRAGECGNRLLLGNFMPRNTRFEGATIAGRPALIRSDCGVVDAIVDVDGDAMLLVLQSGRSRQTGNTRLFVELTKSLEIDDRP